MKLSASVRAIALLLALWLPVQTLAGISAPFCEHMLAHGAAAQAASDAGHGHAGHADDGREASPADRHGNCEDCGLCTFACTYFLPGRQSALGSETGTARFESTCQPAKSCSPRLLQRPPLALG